MLLLAPGLAAAQTIYPFVVKGQIGSLNAPTKIYLVKGEVLDSATLQNGQFELKGVMQWLGSAELIFPAARLPHRIFGARPGRSYQPNSPLHARITGGPLTADYQRLSAALKPAGTTPRGKAVSLSDYRGKYVLLNFWASWCNACRQENPAIIKPYTAYENRSLDILSVSLDEEELRDLWVQAIADDHLPWAQVSDRRGLLNEAAMLYGVDIISRNFLIDPAGKIVASNLHGNALAATLAKFIK